MKRLTAAALSAILLADCGSGKTDSSDARSALPPLPKAAELTTAQQTAETSSAESRIIYRERLYNINSYTKSDLIVQSDGTVWCGFYMHNEGTIDRFNRLWLSDEEYSDLYELDDDKWLKSVLTETDEDDFMLVGDIVKLGTLGDDEIQKLNTLVSAADPLSACNIRKASAEEAEPEVIETEYSFADLVVKNEIYRVYAYTQSYERTVQDDSANEALKLVQASPLYAEWREKCAKELVPFE